MNIDHVDLEQACEHAVAWARLAGNRVLQRFDSEQIERSRKADDSLVTSVDLELDALILSEIHRCYPDHAACSEESCEAESGPATRHSEYCWIVDPLDGTRNFAHGLHLCCVAIALCRSGVPILGVIHDLSTQRMYTAIRGRGAFVDGTRLSTCSSGWHRDSLIGIPTAKRTPLPPVVTDLWSRRSALRNFGSTCLHLAWVAAGRLDACFGLETGLWDIAAGALLVSEAGGRVTSIEGESIFPVDTKAYTREPVSFLAGGPTIHGLLLETLA